MVVYDGEAICRLESPLLVDAGVKEGDAVLVRRGFISERRGRRRIIASSDALSIAEREEAEKAPSVNRLKKLSEITDEEADVIVEGMLYTKTPLGVVETRFGPAEKISFWLKDGDTTMLGSAWRAKAKEIDSVPNGERIQLRWVRIRRNQFGELEIAVENDTKVQRLESL